MNEIEQRGDVLYYEGTDIEVDVGRYLEDHDWIMQPIAHRRTKGKRQAE